MARSTRGSGALATCIFPCLNEEEPRHAYLSAGKDSLSSSAGEVNAAASAAAGLGATMGIRQIQSRTWAADLATQSTGMALLVLLWSRDEAAMASGRREARAMLRRKDFRAPTEEA